MLIHQMRPRMVFLEDARKLSFPSEARIDVVFSPNPGLGGPAPPGQTVPAGGSVRLEWNANIGRSTAVPQQPLREIDLTADLGGATVRLQGPRLTADFDCATRAVLLEMIWAVHYVLPLLLSIEFLDAPTVATTSGRVGDVPFTWQVAQTQGEFETTTAENQQDKVSKAIARIPAVRAQEDRPLLAALAYFQRATRLATAGDAAYEFAGEVVLNLAKCLQALFPPVKERSREPVRQGLASLRVPSDEVETWFVPALILRDTLDVAHIRLTSLSVEQQQTLQVYSEHAISHFRGLMKRVFSAVEDGSLALPTYVDQGPDEDTKKALQMLRMNISNTNDVLGK